MTMQAVAQDANALPTWTDPIGQFIAGQISPRTQHAYMADLREFFATDHVTMDDVRSVQFTDVIAWRNRLSEQGYKRSTINRKLSSVKSFYKMVKALGAIDRNPADPALVRGYREEPSVAGKAMTTETIRAIMDAVEQETDELERARDMALVSLLTYGGLRRSETAAMDWEHIVKQDDHTILTLPVTKSGVAQYIKLHSIVLSHLDAYRQQLQAHGKPTTGHVFMSLSTNPSYGQRLSGTAINALVQRYAAKAGVDHVTAHMFRHTCCTLAIEGGAKPQQVQAHLRHKALTTTMRYYEHRENLVDNASDYITIGE